MAPMPLRDLAMPLRLFGIAIYVASVVVTGAIANVCGEASAAFERGPGLPMAKLEASRFVS
jgi:hypothetical protein